MVSHEECFERLRALSRRGLSHDGTVCVKNSPKWRQESWMSAEDTEARADAVKFADAHVPMALENPDPESPLEDENPKTPKHRRRTAEEIEADKLARAEAAAAKKAETARRREEAKAQRAREREQARIDAKREKIREAEGGEVQLPAVVMRDGTVVHVSDADAWAVCEMYLDDMCLDVETSGYPLGHALYELRTVQLGGEHAAVVFDAADPAQTAIASLALTLAKKLRAHSATADIIPSVHAGLIEWDAAWAKTQDSVLNAKLTDPKMSGSDADALKELAADLLREYAVSPNAEKAKNALFKEMGCLVKTDLTTPKEKNGWYCVNKNSVVMTRYAGSDVLDLAAVLRVLPPIPVPDSVMEREREFQAACATVTRDGFRLDHDHVKKKVAEEEQAKAESQRAVEILSDGKIVNPKSTDVLKFLPEVIPGLVLPVHRKTKAPTADKGALEGLALQYKDDPLAFHLFKQILAYRHHDTTLGLLLRPFDIMCEHGDGRARTTIYTIEASTGRTSSRRFNAQQLSRQGGVRACICADPGMLGITADFEGCEVRVAAGLSGDHALLQAEAGPYCHKCGSSDTQDKDCNTCGPGKAHKGLHWLAAHEAFGTEATKEHRYWCKRGIFCVPEDGTEILTRRGWLKHDEVKPGDETLGRNAAGRLEWTRVEAVPHFTDAGLVKISSGKHWAATVTPDHRWVTDKRRDGGSRGHYREDGFTRTEDIGAEHRIIVSAVADTEHQLDITPAEAALIAWVYTDGHLTQVPFTGRTAQGSDGRRRKMTTCILQAKPLGIAALEAVLTETGADYRMTERPRAKAHHLQCREYKLRTAYVRDLWRRAGLLDVADKTQPGFDLESFVMKLGQSARAAFLQAALDAEGFKNKHGQWVFSQNEGPVYDALLLAATLEGYHVRQYRSRYPGGSAVHVTMALSRHPVGGTRLKREDAGRADVWCVTTGLGSWVMRQEGRIMLTGNCKLFGGGPDTAASQVYCDVVSMQNVFKAFESIAVTYTEWDRWLRSCYKDGSMVWRDYATGTNYSQPIDGANRMIYRAYSGRNIYIGNGQHAAGNGAIQGTARELLVDGTLLWRKTPWGKYPLLPVHDQLLTFVPAGEAHEATRTLKACMATDVLSSPGFDVHIGADVDEPFASWQDSS